MTSIAQKSRADIPRACRGNIRAAFLTLSLVVFFSLALVPLSANIDNSGIVSVQRCEAFADITPTEYGYEFLEAVSGQAGLSVNDTVATVTGVTASATGLVIANTTGIVFGASGNRALKNLADAADYPAWDTLSTEQQTAWGSEVNYDAAKFNSLMDAYGLQSDRERFYSTGGANFEFSQESIDNIQLLGSIGSRWANNIGVTMSDIAGSILNRNAIVAWFPVSSSGGLVYNAENVSDWPNDYPTTVNYNIGIDPLGVYYKNGTAVWTYKDFSAPVYKVLWIYPYGTNTKIRLDSFSTQPFTLRYGSYNVENTNPSLQEKPATSATYQGHTFYYSMNSAMIANYTASFGAEPNVSDPQMTSIYMGAILFNTDGETSGGSENETLPEYPEEEIDQDTEVYYPEEGITPTVSWPVYIEPQRPKNEYNPDDQTGKNEWKQETKQNVMPLQNIRFDKLFPFCLMTDVKDLTEKIEDTLTPGQQSDYLKIKIPMAYASDGEGEPVSEEMELDGTPLRDLLVMVRPFNQILLLFLMVFSLVMFWKSILTGD